MYDYVTCEKMDWNEEEYEIWRCLTALYIGLLSNEIAVEYGIH